jgi:hypothetical protein
MRERRPEPTPQLLKEIAEHFNASQHPGSCAPKTASDQPFERPIADTPSIPDESLESIATDVVARALDRRDLEEREQASQHPQGKEERAERIRTVRERIRDWAPEIGVFAVVVELAKTLLGL